MSEIISIINSWISVTRRFNIDCHECLTFLWHIFNDVNDSLNTAKIFIWKIFFFTSSQKRGKLYKVFRLKLGKQTEENASFENKKHHEDNRIRTGWVEKALIDINVCLCACDTLKSILFWLIIIEAYAYLWLLQRLRMSSERSIE